MYCTENLVVSCQSVKMLKLRKVSHATWVIHKKYTFYLQKVGMLSPHVSVLFYKYLTQDNSEIFPQKAIKTQSTAKKS